MLVTQQDLRTFYYSPGYLGVGFHSRGWSRFPGRGGVALPVLLRVEEKNAHLSFQSAAAAAATTQALCAAHKPANRPQTQTIMSTYSTTRRPEATSVFSESMGGEAGTSQLLEG